MYIWKEIQTWQKSDAKQIGGTRYTNSADVWVEVGVGAGIEADALIGAHAFIGAHARIGAHAFIGVDALIEAHARIESTPLYLHPAGGEWPIYVSDPEKRLVGIGCEVHAIDWWLDGGAGKIRKNHKCEETDLIYDPAIEAVAKLMGWETRRN